jgi:DNA-binding CsgD family transcriptional regulator
MDAAWTLKALCDAFEALQSAKTCEELRVQMGRFARQAGFDQFVYALTVKSPLLKDQHYILGGFPEKWLERYVREGYFKVDPIVRYAQSTSLPAIWSDEIFHDSKSAQFWEEAKSFGLSQGLSFAVHEQPGATGIFSLARDKPLDLPEQEMAALIGRAQLFAGMLHHAVSRLNLPKLLPSKDVSLTPRERECLIWSADGKTAWEIGRILSIAERTVVFHVNNAIQKLGATNKTQAIVRAVALNLLL